MILMMRWVENPQGFGNDERRFVIWETIFIDHILSIRAYPRHPRDPRSRSLFPPASILPTTASINFSLSACKRMSPVSRLSQSDMSWSTLATMGADRMKKDRR
jgi:hypothetical protein